MLPTYFSCMQPSLLLVLVFCFSFIRSVQCLDADRLVAKPEALVKKPSQFDLPMEFVTANQCEQCSMSLLLSRQNVCGTMANFEVVGLDEDNFQEDSWLSGHEWLHHR